MCVNVNIKYTVRNKKEIVGKLRSNPKLQINKPGRGVYQIMNPGVFKTANRENTVSLDEDDSNSIEEQLGDGFMLVHRNTLVAAKAIHEVSDKIYLSNGETLHYVVRKKKTMKNQLGEIQRRIKRRFVPIMSFHARYVVMSFEEVDSYQGNQKYTVE